MKRSIYQSMYALLIMASGTLLLLHNINVIDIGANDLWHLLYPAVFIIYGLKVVTDSLVWMRKRKRFNLDWFWGASLVLLGVFLILGRIDMITFHIGMVWRLWPLVLVYIGLTTLFSNDRGIHIHWCDECEGEKTSCWTCGSEADENTNWHKHISVGKFRRNQANWSAEAMDLTNSIGEYELDFTRAFIPDENVPITMKGWVGDVKILIPKDVEFSLRARAVVGDVYVAGQSQEGFNPSLRYKTPGYDEATRKLTIDIFYRILDLRVDHV